MAQLPEAAAPFEGTQFPFPVSEALFAGPRIWRPTAAGGGTGGFRRSRPRRRLWAALLAAEAIELTQADRGERFIGDGRPGGR